MSIRNTADTYGSIARFLHWAMALIIFCLVPVGLYMTQMAYGPEKLQVYALHKSFGLLVLWLAGLRLFWRFWSMPPDAQETHTRLERLLAGGVHIFLYVCMIGLPVSGWVMSSAAEYPVPFFGLSMPPLTGKDEALAELAEEAHGVMAWGLVGLLGLHIAGAFKHHILDRDLTLQRMVPGKAGLVPVVLLSVIVAGFFAVVGILALREEEEEHGAAEAVADVSSVSVPDLQTLGPSGWAIVPGQSRLGFEAMLYGQPFTGVFTQFDGNIRFDPDDLAGSKADITIAMDSVDSGDSERDTQMRGSDWFDVLSFPAARFETMVFERGADNNYVVVGNLTIRDVMLPVTLPFTLEIKENQDGGRIAEMHGSFSISRRGFQIGQGEWAESEDVGDSIRIDVSLTAIQP